MKSGVFATIFCMITVLTSGFARAATPAGVPPRTKQLVVVTAKAWSSTSGTLRAYERRDSTHPWRLVLGPFSASLGRNGLAWGRGLQGLLPEKREGDGKSPAGVFPIPFALGFDDPAHAGNPRIRYVQLGNTVECIDFTDSSYYNQVVDWAPIEELRKRMDPTKPRPRDLLRIGLFIGQNTNPAISGLGSCVYLHLRTHPTETTSGCTAVDEATARKLLQWLDGTAHPVFVLLPKRAYAKYQAQWDLP